MNLAALPEVSKPDGVGIWVERKAAAPSLAWYQFFVEMQWPVAAAAGVPRRRTGRSKQRNLHKEGFQGLQQSRSPHFGLPCMFLGSPFAVSPDAKAASP